jgi:heat shock protein HtpX
MHHDNLSMSWGKIKNMLLTIVFLSLMVVLSMVLGNMLLGGWGIFLAIGVGILSFALSPHVSPHWFLRMSRASRLRYGDSPELFHILDGLAQRAQVPARPSLYLMPGNALNAFTVGRGSDPAIVLTEGLVTVLDRREITGVLAHEISHIKNGDLWMMGFADSFRRFTHTLSLFGLFFLLFNMPLLLFGRSALPFGFFLLLIAAPAFSLILEMALSRTREFEADRMTVELTGDPWGFVSALKKIDYRYFRVWNLLFGYPSRHGNMEGRSSNLFRTHPTIDERIRRIEPETR